MSRSNYSDDPDDWGHLYRRAVNLSLSGRRGQTFLRELRDALESLPDKKLTADTLADASGYCALGAVGRARGLPVEALADTHYEAHAAAKLFDIAPSMAAEIVFENDESEYASHESDEARYEHMLSWTKRRIKPEPAPSPRGRCSWCCREFTLLRGRVRWHKHAGDECPGAKREPKELA